MPTAHTEFTSYARDPFTGSDHTDRMQPDPRQLHPSNGTSADQLSLRTQVIGRRRALGLFGAAASVVVLAACSDDELPISSPDSSAANGATTATSTTGSSSASTSPPASASTVTPASTAAATPVDVEPMPAETGGPFAADGSNDNGAGEVANVLVIDGVIRSDIRSDIGGGNEQPGVPMSLAVTVIDTATGLPRRRCGRLRVALQPGW